jgi:hypothetical protein
VTATSSVDAVLSGARAGLRRLDPAEAARAQAAGAVLVDIRPHAFRAAEGEIAGALVVERNVLEWRFAPDSPWRLPQAAADAVLVVLCNEGYSSSLARTRCADSACRARPTWSAASGPGPPRGCRPCPAAPRRCPERGGRAVPEVRPAATPEAPGRALASFPHRWKGCTWRCLASWRRRCAAARSR